MLSRFHLRFVLIQSAWARLLLVAVVLTAGSAFAQTYVASSVEAVEPAALTVETAPEVSAPLPVVEQAPAPPAAAEISSVPRRFHYVLRLAMRGLYDDNININSGDRISDFAVVIEPGLLLGFGDTIEHQENFLQFAYSPSLFLYTERSEDDAFQQLVHLEAQYRFSRLTLNLAEDIQILDGTNLDTTSNNGTINERVNLDVSGRSRVNIFTTKLDASYYLAGKTFLSSQVGASIYDYTSLISSESISASLFINYIYGPKLTIGVGGGGGYTFVEGTAPDQTSEQISARFTYDLSGKVSVSGSGGVEFRQFEGNSRGTYTSPVFELGYNYKPFDGTSLTLSASRHVQSSAVLAGQDFTTTTITASAQQRFFRKFTLGLSLGYENSDYFSTVGGTGSNRSDNYYFVQPGIDMTVTRFWTVGAYYLRRQNDSSSASSTFYDNQLGIRTSLTF